MIKEQKEVDTKISTNQNTKKLSQYTEGNIPKQLLYNSIPMIFALGFMISFNLIDTYFVAQLGNKPLAALTFSFPIVFLITGVAMGLGIGASAVISRAIGEGNNNLVQRLTTDSIIIALFFVAIFSGLGLLFLEDIFYLFKAKQDLIPYIRDYMTVILSGNIFIVIPLVGNAATRATGDTKTPSMIMFLAVIINIILDPILLFGWGPIPSLGIAGAAWATVISRFITLIVSLYVLIYRDKMISLKIPILSEFKKSSKSILQVGLPSVLTNLIVPLGFGIIVRFVSKYGESAVAGLGAASRIEIVMLAVFMAFSTVLGPFIGQNLGAKKFDRIRDAIKYGHLFALSWGIITSSILYFFAEEISRTFKNDNEIVAIMILYLQIAPITIGMRGIIINVTTTLNVLKKPFLAAWLNISQVFIIFIPVAFILSNYTEFGLRGIFASSVISSLIVSILSYFILNKELKRLENV
jgi:putative MATE family efflux protein